MKTERSPDPAPGGYNPGRTSARLQVALTVAAGLVLTAAGVTQALQFAEAEAQFRFDQLADRLANAVNYRITRPRQGLNSVRALFAASQSVTRDEFRAFISSREIATEFPGILGFGLITRIGRAELDAFVAAERADNAPGYSVRTTGSAPDLYPIRFIEPRETNQAAMGYDIGSEPVRRAAAELAIRTGQPVLTPRLNLVQDLGQRTGFLYLQPIYRNETTAPDEASRFASLTGIAYAPLIINDLFAGIMGETEGLLDVEVFDGQVSADNLLLDADTQLVGVETDGGEPFGGRRFSLVRQLEPGGRHWTLVMTSTPRFEATVSHSLPWAIGVGGLLVTGLLASMVSVLGRGRARALSLAERMTESLRASEAEAKRLAMVASRTNNGVIVTDAKRRIEWVNEGFTRLTGYTLKEAKGHKPGTLLQGPRSDRAVIQRMREALEAGREFHVEILNYHKLGYPYWVAVEVQPLRGDQGEVVGWMGIESNITERKRAAEELAANEQRMRDLTAQAPGVIFQFEVAGDGSRRFTFLSAGFMELFGRDPAPAMANSGVLFTYLHPDDVRGVGESIEAAIAAEKPWMDSFRIILPDNRERWISARSTCMRTPEGTRIWYGMLSDTSEQDQAREAAEKANRAKSQFLATMSHEIRTPMNGVIGMTSLLLDTQLTPRQREYTEIVRASGETLLSLINDILDFSKIESGRMDLECEPFSIRECIESAVDLFAMKAAQKGIELVYEIGNGVPDEIRGDITRVRQIIVNLLGNALKFTERGEVVLRVSPGAAEPAPPELVFSVRDTGIGIPREARDRLFQSFTQVDASTTRKYGGTGLGLAISRRLAEIMGGRMWVESEEGRGSTFSFTLRAEWLPPRPARTALLHAGPQLRGRRLLVVDANETNRRLLHDLSEKWGMHAITVPDARDALKRLKEGVTFDLVLVDQNLAVMDGIDLARAIRALPGCAPLPVILLSTIGREAAAEARDIVASVVSKPIKPSQLFDSIANAFGIPLGPQATAPGFAASDPERPAEPAALRLLLAEDNPVNQKVAQHMLSRLGFRADTAANGLEVLAALERQAYDAILMDVQMPEMDGVETTRRIRASHAQGTPPPWIIALTANAMQGDREEYLREGMDDYLSKPIKLQDLAAALDRATKARAKARLTR